MPRLQVIQKLKQNLCLKIEEKVLDFIETQSSKSKSVETGGIIAGKGSFEEKLIIVTHASEEGPKAVKKDRFFSRDTVHCQKLVNKWAANSFGKIDYLGEWHKHFEENPRPSAQDKNTMRRIAESKDYHINVTLLLIIGISNNRNSLQVFLIDSKGKVSKVQWEPSHNKQSGISKVR